MTQFSGKVDMRSRLTIFGLVFAIACWLMLNERAAAAEFCVWQAQPEVGQIAPGDELAIKKLVADFYYKTYDTPVVDADRLSNLQSLFAKKFVFEVCTGGGNNQLFISEDFTTLEVEFKENYHDLWDNAIKPIHLVANTVLTPVGKDIVQERSIVALFIQKPDTAGPVIEYTAELLGIVVRDESGNWRFRKRLIIIDNPSTVSYAR
jgi:hypothetical protein